MKPITVQLPFPPTANHVWKHRVIGKRAMVYKTKEGKAYQDYVCRYVKAMGYPSYGTARLQVVVNVHMPDRRKRDLGNLDKVLMDSLERSGLFDNDSQIDDLRYIRKEVIKEGRVIVNITPLSPTQQSII